MGISLTQLPRLCFFVNFKPIVHNLYLTRDNDKRGMRARPEDKTIDHR